MTATEAAYNVAIDALYNAFRVHKTETGKQRGEKRALARLHNLLLRDSGLDGVGLETN